jgi:hypothetical protein
MILALFLSGCAGAFSVPPNPPPPEPVVEDALDFGGWCFVRARLFRGLVPIRCRNLAEEFRP